MKNFFVCAAMLLISAGVQAQGEQFSGLDQYLSNRNELLKQGAQYKGVQGSPYLYDEWTTGTVYTRVGTFKNEKIKFNLKEGEIQIRTSKGDSIYVNRAEVDSFALEAKAGRQVFVLKNFDLEGRRVSAYLLRIHQGKKAGYYRHYAREIEYAQPNSTHSYGAPPQNQFINRYRDVLLKGEKAREVKLSRKSVVEAIGEQKDSLEAFIKQKGLRFKSDEDVSAILRYYESL